MKKETIEFSGAKLEIAGRLFRRATLWDEAWLEESLRDPTEYVRLLSGTESHRADIFSFFRPLPAAEPDLPFHFEWENVAVVPVTTFAAWWESLPQESRKNVRRAEKRGAIVRTVPFDDSLVRGISEIYNETPIRQGRRFWHYRKPLEQVKRENGTYLERAQFLGAFLGEELIGFLKFVMVNKVARIMQILSKEAHMDKRPMNALLAKAVEVCASRGASHFVYGEYVYGTKETSPMTEFKRRNGFQRLNYPRYFVPLTTKGKLLLRLGLHRDLLDLVPEPVVSVYLKARAELFKRTLRSGKVSGPAMSVDPEKPASPLPAR